MASAVQDSIDSVLQSACVDGARYRAGDLLGKLLAHISLTPYLVLFYQVCIVYSRREIHEAVLLFGALVNIVVGRLLKRAIHQTRPLSTCEALGICTKPGMPSSHAQIILFAFGIFVFQLFHHQRAVTKDTVQHLGWAVKSFSFLGVSFLVAYSRVYLGYHTVLQVAAGAAAGLLMAALWWSITAGIAQHFVKLQRSGLGRLFRLKDTWQIPDMLLFEQNCMEHVPVPPVQKELSRKE